MNRNPIGDECMIFFCSNAFLKLGLAIRILDKSSSVKLPLDDVHRNVKKVGRQDHGDSEGVPVVKKGQEVCCSGLRHVLTRLEGHRRVFLGSLLPRHVPTKKNGSKAVLEVEPEDHAEGGSKDDCKSYIGEDLAVGAFHAFSQNSSSNWATASFFVLPNALPECTPLTQRVTIQPFRPFREAFWNVYLTIMVCFR